MNPSGWIWPGYSVLHESAEGELPENCCTALSQSTSGWFPNDNVPSLSVWSCHTLSIANSQSLSGLVNYLACLYFLAGRLCSSRLRSGAAWQAHSPDQLHGNQIPA